jgi:hypothetical protein
MPRFILSKQAGPKVNWMEKQTRKAILLHLVDVNGNQGAYWIPKSQAVLEPHEGFFIVDVTQWAWENRKPAVGMGCL